MTDGTGLSPTQARMTQDGAILGTPLFLTPEQALGETEKIGAATDVWPMGLIACELLTGSSYWSEEQMTTLLAKIIFKQLVPPSEKGVKLGPRFDEWFLRSCAREPADRWPSVGAQIEALADALQVDRALLTAPEPPPALRAWLAARMSRTDLVKQPQLNLATLTETALPVRPSTKLAQVAADESSSEIVVMDAASQRSLDAANQAVARRKQRRRIVITVALSAFLTIALVLGGIGIMRMRSSHTAPAAAQAAGAY